MADLQRATNFQKRKYMICPDTDRPCRINGCGNGQCYRRNYHEKPDDKQQGHAALAGVVLSCPFCGGNDLVFDESKSPDKSITWHHLHHVPTNECSVSFMHSNKERLIELWNRRT